MLGGAGAGDHSEGRLELTKKRRLLCGEAHIARQDELAARPPDPPRDLGDADEAARAQVTEQETERRLAGQLNRGLAVLPDPGDVDVGDEIVGSGSALLNTATRKASSASAHWRRETRSRTSSGARR